MRSPLRTFWRGLSNRDRLVVAGILFSLLLLASRVISLGVREVAVAFTAQGIWLHRYTERIFFPEDTVMAQYREAGAQVAELSTRLAEREAEVKSLQDAQVFLARAQSGSAWQSTYARVLLFAQVGDRAQMTINRGETSGLVSGSAVIGPQGTLLGRVGRVQKDRATVELVSEMGSRIPVALSGAQETIGLLEGRGGEELRLLYIPRGTAVAAGALLVTNGRDGAMRPNIPVGQLTEILDDQSNPFLEGIVTLLERPSEVTLVEVASLPE